MMKKQPVVVPWSVLVALTWACGGSWAEVITADQLAYLQTEENAFRNKTIIDISHKYVVGMPYFFGGPHGLQPFFTPVSSIAKGDKSNSATFNLSTHCGTHVDAPSHFNQTLMDEGYDVNSLDLRTLNGPVLMVDTPRNKNITVRGGPRKVILGRKYFWDSKYFLEEQKLFFLYIYIKKNLLGGGSPLGLYYGPPLITAEVTKSLNIPRGVKRALFKTLNTDRNLMNQSAFDSSYTGFTMTEPGIWSRTLTSNLLA
ncbi:unnamed protein product [Cuscuta europaea]|uniref:Uncharacterized protein n=1 Tax=Cuscuta europaea TaxID=41803 RepID=A0A9P0ZJR8_CUSEU|nr:unnamed protein product [Cuscuta europaea]